MRSDSAPEHVAAAEKAGLTIIGEATQDPYLYISHNGTTLIDTKVDQLQPIWKDGLAKYFFDPSPPPPGNRRPKAIVCSAGPTAVMRAPLPALAFQAQTSYSPPHEHHP